jgi:hypothetical protein
MFVNVNGDHGAKEITSTMNSYYQALGEHINLAKSSILFSKGCANPIIDEVKHILNVPNESLSDKYLGMPSHVGNSKNGAIKFLKDRYRNKVRGWVDKLLFWGGRKFLSNILPNRF